jgi:deoxyribonuclease V
VGCAKSRLIGTHGPVGHSRGATADLVADDEVIGAVLRTRDGVTPVFVSVGHLIDLAGAVDLVLRTTPRYRVPEPIRLAHRATVELRRRVDPTLPQPVEHAYPGFISE